MIAVSWGRQERGGLTHLAPLSAAMPVTVVVEDVTVTRVMNLQNFAPGGAAMCRRRELAHDIVEVHKRRPGVSG